MLSCFQFNCGHTQFDQLSYFILLSIVIRYVTLQAVRLELNFRIARATLSDIRHNALMTQKDLQ